MPLTKIMQAWNAQQEDSRKTAIQYGRIKSWEKANEKVTKFWVSALNQLAEEIKVGEEPNKDCSWTYANQIQQEKINSFFNN